MQKEGENNLSERSSDQVAVEVKTCELKPISQGGGGQREAPYIS